jgi:enoyl-CoA hydratase
VTADQTPSSPGRVEGIDSIRYGAADHPGVRLLIIDRPAKMNAIGADEARGLEKAIEEFRLDPHARVLVITGAGGDAFCAGADLHAVAAMAGVEDGRPLFVPEDPDRPQSPGVGNIGPTRIHDIYKPVIAAVNGVAYAGGLEWACFAHLRIADRHASFGVTCRRWNVGLGDGGTQRLPRIVGLGRALDLILTGRVIGAEEAERIGLVNEVTPSGCCLDRALEVAATLADLPQGALRTDLEATVRGSGLPLDHGLEIERECFDRLLVDPELVEGAGRFLRRDHPDRMPGAPSLHRPATAWAFARESHAGQTDRFGRSFVAHPAAVADLCGALGDEDAVVAAYLHDAVEKGSASLDDLGATFGPRVQKMVETLGQDGAIADRQARREDHRRRVAASDPTTIAVYVNDRRDGIRTLTRLVEAGHDPDEFDAAGRPADWRGDLAAVSNLGVQPELIEAMRTELENLEFLLSRA